MQGVGSILLLSRTTVFILAHIECQHTTLSVPVLQISVGQSVRFGCVALSVQPQNGRTKQNG